MQNEYGLIFLHGLESSSQGFKARMLHGMFPTMLTPDFQGTLAERMAQLEPILDTRPTWRIVGSSFGGLMGALYTCRNPHKVQRLVLLAPALPRPDFADHPPAPVAVPVTVYHGKSDTVVPLDATQALAEQVFTNLRFHVVDDDHMLRWTVQSIDWVALLETA